MKKVKIRTGGVMEYIVIQTISKNTQDTICVILQRMLAEDFTEDDYIE